MTQNKNREFHERALKVIPGPNSNLRLPSVVEPVYMVEAHGARFQDVNGKEYIDYGHGGQGILGHGNKEYTATLQKQLDKLFTCIPVSSAPRWKLNWPKKWQH